MKKYNQNPKRVVGIIPTYKPTSLTIKLVKSLCLYYEEMEIVIVDDCTPDSDYKSQEVLKKLSDFSHKQSRVHFVQTPSNRLKAGALNYGFSYIKDMEKLPDVVVTFDDDVIVLKHTILMMIDELSKESNIGAVCTRVKIKNKNKNLLTRLQGLEYHNFNVTKISSNGFMRGPLVMHGMLVAFRYEAFNSVDGFRENLIEDYEITARLKREGYTVKIVKNAWAWTTVPEDFATLWKQRVRWSFGGLTVLRDHFRYLPSVFQDLVGHVLFFTLLLTIVSSFFVPPTEPLSPLFVRILILVSFIQFAVSYMFNIITLIYYKSGDIIDHLIRVSILPEYVYSMVMTGILLGSYAFFVFTLIYKTRTDTLLYKTINGIFYRLGYSQSWGSKV